MMDKITPISGGGITSPTGFTAAGIVAELKQSGAPDLALIRSVCEAHFATMFTTCRFAAAPVQLSKEKTQKEEFIQAIVINSGNANACTGDEGYNNARAMADQVAAGLGIHSGQVLVASTGRIGVQLPMEKISKGIDLAITELSPTAGNLAAQAIITTDTREKEFAVEVSTNKGKYRIGGITKGAGMISPKLTVPHATMISCLTTDAEVDNSLLTTSLEKATNHSFNRITIDGDMSTNDSVFLMANGQSEITIEADSTEAEEFISALTKVTQHLAKEMVRDGEGVTKLVTVKVINAANDEDAEKCARAISDSLLCKTAWFGNDPNWGRVLAAAGYSGAKFNPEQVDLDYDHHPVVRNGCGAETREEDLVEVLKQPEFTISLYLNAGTSETAMWTNDISYEYVKINADYHT